MISTYTHIKRLACGMVALCFFCNMSITAHAQNKAPDNTNDAQQKLEDLKMAYLTQQLDLNPKEAEKFWPLYNQYQKDMQNIIEERKQIQMDKNQLNKADNKQIEQNMTRDFQLQQQALQIRQKYRKEFQNVLPPRKVMKVYRSEKDFNMKLIEELQRRQQAVPARTNPATRPQPAPGVRPPRMQPSQPTPPRRFDRPEKQPASRPARSSRPRSR